MRVVVTLGGVEQRIRADLRGELPGRSERGPNSIELEVEENASVEQLRELLGIDSGWLAIVDGRRAVDEERLQGGAEVAFLAPLAGG